MDTIYRKRAIILTLIKIICARETVKRDFEVLEKLINYTRFCIRGKYKKK